MQREHSLDTDELLSLAELAEHLGKSRQCLYQWRARRVFPFRVYGSGRRLRVNRKEVDEYVARNGAVPGPPPVEPTNNHEDSAPAPVIENHRDMEIPLGESVTLPVAAEMVRRIENGARLSVVLGESGCCLRIAMR